MCKKKQGELNQSEMEEFSRLIEREEVNVNLVNDEIPWNTRTALHWAAMFGQLEVVKYLLEKVGAEVNVKDNQWGWTALHRAASGGHLEVLKYLLEKVGAEVNVQNK